jgi:NADPH:quinone reductase-like Zn-dependent oxidoreductase
MKQIWITRAGGPEVLSLRETEDPSPREHEVCIDVRAAGVNFADVMARIGKYADAPPIPCVIGYEVAGIVRGAGKGVSHLKKGDRVFGLTNFGGYSSVVCAPENQLMAMPEPMSFEQAAAIPVNYFTAYLALVRFGNLQPGERVLIHNVGGGVGMAATQLATRIGARIFGTASAWKHEQLASLGVHELIDYRTTDWVAELKERTGGEGVHVILDPIGGRNVAKDLQVLAPVGRLAVYGFSEPVRNGRRPLLATLRSAFGMPRPSFISLLNHSWSVGGLNLGRLWPEIDRLRPVMDAILASCESGAIRPVIARVFPFEQIADAHRLLEERKNLGKAVIVC